MKFDSGNAAGLIAYSALFDHGLAPCVRTSDGRCCSYRVNPSRGNNFVSRYSGHSGRRVRMFVSPACDSRPLRFAVSRRLIICAACFPSHDNPMDGVFCVFRSIRSRIGIEVRSAIRIHSINRELNFFYRFLTRFFAAFHYRGIFPQ